MTVHIERCHHRTAVWQKYRRWLASCNHCGWMPHDSRGLVWFRTQREAFIAALDHAEGSLR